MRKTIFAIMCFTVLVAIASFFVVGFGKIVDSCEKAGGVYLQKDMVCARADGSGYITDY